MGLSKVTYCIFVFVRDTNDIQKNMHTISDRCYIDMSLETDKIGLVCLIMIPIRKKYIQYPAI